jgi:hypothetical protein
LGHGRFEVKEAVSGAPVSTVDLKNRIFLESSTGLGLPRPGLLDPLSCQNDGPPTLPRERKRLFESQNPGCLLLAPGRNGTQRH